MAERRPLELGAAPARHPLHWCLLRVRGSEGQVVGAAFLAAEGLACTCAHVVAEALGLDETSPEKPSGEVRLDLYRDGTPLVGKVECWIAARAEDDDGPEPRDIALLSVSDPTGAEVRGRAVRLLAPGRLTGHAFEALGFPGGEPAGVFAHGAFWEQRADGTFQIESTGATGVRVQPGFSGAPVWDQRAGGVVGMVVSSWRDTQARTAFMIPVVVIAAATGGSLRIARSSGPFDLLIAGVSNPRGLNLFLQDYLGTAERPVPFAGREDELEALDRWLDEPERPYRLLAAPAGKGKSALLARWAMEVAESGRAEVEGVALPV